MKIHFKTFGCKVNQCETADMQREAERAGCNLSAIQNSDVIVVNSCTVTAGADNKTKQFLRKCKRMNPGSKIFLTGCLADRAEKAMKKEFPGIKLFRNSDKIKILDVLKVKSMCEQNSVQNGFNGHTRAFLKIQDGCDGKCSYCVVPKVRPKLESKDIDEVVVEAKKYVSAGHKEIVLCGIRLGKYKFRGQGLVDLIIKLEKINGLYRIRLSSIELKDINDKLMGLMSKSKRLCHHLHIPLQSGDDAILKSMKRPYNLCSFYKKIKEIGKKVPDIGITTDIIIGYPLDTDESLQNTYNFVGKCGFSRLHVFKFSKRPGTKAALIKSECPTNIVDKWGNKFKELDLKLRKNFLERYSGKKMKVLSETNGYGYTSNYMYVKLPKNVPANEIVYI